MLSHHALAKVTKSKYNLIFFNLKLIAKSSLRYFSNKCAFDDKLKVSCQAGVGNYLICNYSYYNYNYNSILFHLN